jgi:ring-1,2-phenylacetyl-CoA epoxidase subunit PaaD
VTAVPPVVDIAGIGEIAAARPLVRERQVRALLDTVPDPEIPNVSITELGMIGAIEIRARGIRVELLPTFVGCPAVELIRTGIVERLAVLGAPVEVVVSFATPWTTERISPAGREKLRQSGFAPPPPAASSGRSLPVLDVIAIGGPEEASPCPYCGSHRTVLDSAFGPTLCRSIRHCAACRQPFEAFKRI